jgi:predicted SprT family Zn-dependent metalloprotease
MKIDIKSKKIANYLIQGDGDLRNAVSGMDLAAAWIDDEKRYLCTDCAQKSLFFANREVVDVKPVEIGERYVCHECGSKISNDEEG